ncbi:MAG: ADP-ribosylglycohydrolase family protein [Candidatus Dadabacteria bacterium]|nr:MAG: ADP-ribosylglycohydrolase family protein [Candidatus Dadabacteria bacterium]
MLGCLLGLAVGDAIGTTVEFRPRGSFAPLTDMVGGGPFDLPAGAWTDDTSMALCLADSLLSCSGFDPADQMRRYLEWYRNGLWSSTGRCFDIGNTVRAALHRFEQSGEPFAGSTDPHSAGNGSIMRLAPVPMFFYPDISAAIRQAAESSRTTHGAAECVDACRLLAAMLCHAFDGRSKSHVLHPDGLNPAELSPRIAAIARGSYRAKSADEIRGSGYVVDALEAACWCFWRTDNFRDAVLLAANLGDDADTTAAIVGQIAGAWYGVEAIPAPWLDRLVMAEDIRELALQLCHHKPTHRS